MLVKTAMTLQFKFKLCAHAGKNFIFFLCIVRVGRLCFLPLNAVECLSSVVRGDGAARFLCGHPHAASGSTRNVRPRVGCHGRSDAAHSGSSPPIGRELENDFSSLSFSIPSSERFSSHLLYKTATIGAVSPRWSSWSHWAAECVWKHLCVPSDGVFPQTYSPARFIHLMSSQIAFTAST